MKKFILPLALLAALASVPTLHAVTYNWSNNGTNFNAAASWGGTLPGTSDIANFGNASVTQPNLTANITIQRLTFGAASASGYVLTANSPFSLTLTNATAIANSATSGFNLISAPIILGAAANSTQAIDPGNSGVLVISGPISATSANVTVSKPTSSGTLFLTGSNSFSGNLSISQGTLVANTLGNQSESSNIGAGSKVTLGSATPTAGTLTYTGASKTTDRLLDLGGTTAGGTLDQSGTGALKFTSGVTASGAGNKTLVLQGSTTGTGEISGVIQNYDGTRWTALTKNGSGTWTLSGANSFTGNVSVNEGRLVLDYGTNANVLGGTNAFNLRGGVLEFKGKSSGVSSQTSGTITITASATDFARLSTVRLNENGGAGFNLTTGAITTAAKAGATVFDLYNSSNSSVKIGTAITGDSNTNGSILVRTAAGVYDFAVNGGNTSNSLSARGASATIGATNGNSTFDYLVTNNSSVGTGSAGVAVSALTLRIAPTTNNQTLTINNVSSTAGGGAAGLLIGSGGLLYDGGSNNFTIAAAGSTDAALRSANSGGGLNIYHMGTGTLTIGPRVYLGYDSNGSSPNNNPLLFAGVGGLIDLQGGMNSAPNTTAVTGISGVTLRVSGTTRPLNLTNTATGVGTMYLEIGDGGIIEAVNGNITRNVSLTIGGGALRMSGDAGFSAYGGGRAVQLNNGTSSVTWGSGGFVTGALILSSNFSNSTIDFQNGIDLGPVQRVVRVNNGSATVDAKISGALTSTYGGGLVKEGNGTLQVTGANTYGGNTTVSVGTLLVSNTSGSGTGTGAVSVSASAAIGGNGTISGALSLTSNATFVFSLTDTLHVTGNVTLDNTFAVASLVNADRSAVDWTAVSNGTYSLINTTSNLSNIHNWGVGNAASLAGGKSAYFQQPGSTLDLVVVPEPETWALLAFSLTTVVVLRRRKAI